MTIDVRLFGTFHLTHNGHANDAINGSPRLQALLAYLLLHHDTPQPRQQIAYQLWPVSSESQARTNLRKLFLQLRRALPDADTYLAFDNQTITWQGNAPFTCDVVEVQGLLHKLHVNPLDREALPQLFDLYRGELLPSCYDDWIVPLRMQLHQDVMAALDRLVTLLENQRAYDEGIRYAQRLLSLDPLAEKSYQRLMRLRAADGDRTGALRAYQDCVRTLEQELGVDPAPETVALYEQVLNHTPQPTPKGSRTRPTADQPPLIGRQPEWQILRNAWQRALRGQPGLVTIAGEAGIGKTRLAEELLQWAGQQGVLTVRTRSYQAQGALAYAPIAELLQTAAIRPRLGGLNEHRLSHVARLLPELLTEHPNLPPPQPMTESWQRQQFFDALAHAVLADEQPLVLLFDDLQWADGETLTWLHFLLRAVRTAPLLIVGTVRTGEIASNHPLPPLLGSLRRDDLLTEITLTPLTAEEVQALAQSLQQEPLADEQLAQLYTDTEGNPLFVVESVRAQQDATADLVTNTSQSGLPPKIYGVIRHRLAQLSPETQMLVNLAAVIGRSFTYDVLLEATALNEEEVVDSLDELLTRQIIREQSADSYDFSHDRIRDVAYNEISRTRRRLLHRRVAEVLEHLYQGTLAEVSGRLAEHYEQARLSTKAVDYFYMAGQRAAAQFSHTEALHLLQRALALTDEREYATRYRLLDARAHIHLIHREAEAWAQDLDALTSVVAAWTEEDLLQVQQRQAAVALHRYHYYQQAESKFAESLQQAQQAVQLAGQCGASQIEAEALLACGTALWSLSQFDQAKTVLEQAVEKARSGEFHAIAAEGLERLMQSAMFTGGNISDILTGLDECVTLYGKAQAIGGLASVHGKIAYVLVAQGNGEYAQALDHYQQSLAFHHQMGNRAGEANIMRFMAVTYTCCGDYGAAEKCIQAALAYEAATDRLAWTALVLNHHGFNLFNQGRLRAAQETQEQALAIMRANGLMHFGVKAITALGWIHFYQNEFEIAHQYFVEALDHCRSIKETRQEGYTLTCLGHLLTERNRLEEANHAYQQALTIHHRAEQPNRALEPQAGLAYVNHLSGNDATARQQVDEILEYLESHILDRTEDGFYVYLLCYRILVANRDARATDLLQTTYDQLHARATTINDPEQRRMFWEAMPGHREIQLAWQAAVANGTVEGVAYP